jgi:peptidoglycan/xylan/chitin deacetylase (PgdA/CDA1 family)
MDRILFRFEDPKPKTSIEKPDIHKPFLSENMPQTAPKGGKTAYLTFDDGPSEFTPRLLDLLKENGVPATFFISFLNKDTPEKRRLLKREAEEGHSLGVHSFSHDYYYIYKNEENFLFDFKKMLDIIRDAAGVDPKISRFPGGTSNIVSIVASCGNIIMPRLAGDVESMGFSYFDWNAGGQDAQCPYYPTDGQRTGSQYIICPYPTAGQVIHDVLAQVKGQENLVVLLHDVYEFTVDAVPELIRALRGQGYAFKVLTPDSPKIRHAFATKENILPNLKLSLRVCEFFVQLLESSGK